MEKLHFSQLIFAQAKKYGERPILYQRESLLTPWIALTWNGMATEVMSIAKALYELGVNEYDRVAQFSQNKSENLVVDFALFANRAVMVPIYATSTVAQVEFIVNDSEIEVMFVGDQDQFNVAYEVMERSSFLKKIIVFDHLVSFPEDERIIYYSDFLRTGQKSSHRFEVEQRQTEALDNDLACILYTSGTTGNPKGVMLHHSNLEEAMRIHKIRIHQVTSDDVSIAFLPLSHVYERCWCYYMLSNACSVYINLRPNEIQQAIKDVRPTLMCSVPRFWEKVYIGVNENLSKFSPFMLGVVTWAVATGKQYNLDYLRVGKKPGLILELKYAIADKLIFSKVKRTLGLENAKMLPTAGAKLADHIAQFFISIGIPIVYGYGLTESTATVACFEENDYEIGTVGSVMPGVEVKIGEDNEILLKGKTITAGYYKNPEANKVAFTEDGWFRTGDAGKLVNNRIVLTERIKDLFKTSNGKYIAPQEIETRLSTDKFIEQIAVIGDERNFVTAIVAPNLSEVEKYAQEQKLSYKNIDELLEMQEVKTFILLRINELQKGMAPYELVKRITLIKKAFSIETGELTNTLKIRRAVIMQKYKSEIEQMYL